MSRNIRCLRVPLLACLLLFPADRKAITDVEQVEINWKEKANSHVQDLMNGFEFFYRCCARAVSLSQSAHLAMGVVRLYRNPIHDWRKNEEGKILRTLLHVKQLLEAPGGDDYALQTFPKQFERLQKYIQGSITKLHKSFQSLIPYIERSHPNYLKVDLTKLARLKQSNPLINCSEDEVISSEIENEKTNSKNKALAKVENLIKRLKPLLNWYATVYELPQATGQADQLVQKYGAQVDKLFVENQKKLDQHIIILNDFLFKNKDKACSPIRLQEHLQSLENLINSAIKQSHNCLHPALLAIEQSVLCPQYIQIEDGRATIELLLEENPPTCDQVVQHAFNHRWKVSRRYRHEDDWPESSDDSIRTSVHSVDSSKSTEASETSDNEG